MWVVAGALIRSFFHVGVDAFSFGKRGTLAGLSVSVFETLHGQDSIVAGLVLKAFHFYLGTTVPVAYVVYFRGSVERVGPNHFNILFHSNDEYIGHVFWVHLSVIFGIGVEELAKHCLDPVSGQDGGVDQEVYCCAKAIYGIQ